MLFYQGTWILSHLPESLAPPSLPQSQPTPPPPLGHRPRNSSSPISHLPHFLSLLLLPLLLLPKNPQPSLHLHIGLPSLDSALCRQKLSSNKPLLFSSLFRKYREPRDLCTFMFFFNYSTSPRLKSGHLFPHGHRGYLFCSNLLSWPDSFATFCRESGQNPPFHPRPHNSQTFLQDDFFNVFFWSCLTACSCT